LKLLFANSLRRRHPRLEEAVFSEAKPTKLNLQHGPEAAKSQAQLISPFLPSVLMSQREEAADRF
jgi:hypothetical protein